MRRHLYFYTLIDAPLPDASAMLGGDPSCWLPAPAEQRDNGWIVDLVAEGALPKSFAQHRVLLETGEPISERGRLLRTVAWRSASAPGIFPVLGGDLELVGLQGGGCQLSLMASYRPPLAVAGDAADALLGHHVAEACVRRFVLDTARRMTGVTLGV